MKLLAWMLLSPTQYSEGLSVGSDGDRAKEGSFWDFGGRIVEGLQGNRNRGSLKNKTRVQTA